MLRRTPSDRPANTEETDYVLGTHDDELARLGFQHRLWLAEAAALWDRAGFRPGHTLLDIGCGPGFASFDLCAWVGPKGRVVAVDESVRFVEHLRKRQDSEDVRNLDVIHADVQSHVFTPASADGAYIRWVLCFVPDPLAVVRRVAEALRPGGVLAVQDYLNYLALNLTPPGPAMQRVIEAVAASWRSRGGDCNIGQRLPALMAQCGLRVREVRPIVRVGGPRSALWHWPGTFFRNYLPVLLNMGLITEDDRHRFEVEWNDRSADPNALFCTPIIADFIAEKL